MNQRLLLAASAAAFALLGTAASAQDAAWTGPYVGVSVGYADRSESKGETIGFDTNLDGQFGDTVRTAAGADAFSTGFCAGGYNTNAAPGGCRKDDKSDVELSVRGGYDYQIGQFVVGGVIEYSQLQLQDQVTAFSTTPAGYAFTRELNDLWAFRARGGYAFGNSLVYATGGYAVGSVSHSFNTTNTVNGFAPFGGGDAKGYQLGLGVEHKLTGNISLGAEWLRTSLDDDDYGVRARNSGTTAPTNPFLLQNTAGTDFLRTSDKLKFNTFKATLNYRF